MYLIFAPIPYGQVIGRL